jgi:type I restriction enzyme S subunit
MTGLPAGWAVATVGELMPPRYGKAAPKESSGHVPVAASSGVIRVAPTALTEDRTIVVGRKGAVGRVQLFNEPVWPTDTTYYLQVPESLDARFMALQLEHSQLGRLDRSTAVPSLQRPDLEAVVLRVPPLPEQERIVAAIEKEFSRIASATTSLSRSRSRLRSLRYATLSGAITGQWPQKCVGDLVLSLRNGVFSSRPALLPPGTRIFRISAIRPLHLDIDDVRYARDTPDHSGGYLVEAGDILMTRYSGNPGYVGACAVVPAGVPPTLHPDKLIRIVPDPSKLVPDFLALALSAGRGRHQIEDRLKTTAGQVGIAGGQVRTITVPVPPLDAQMSIVSRVQQQLDAIRLMTAGIVGTEEKSAALRSSILSAAFSGKLCGPSEESAA